MSDKVDRKFFNYGHLADGKMKSVSICCSDLAELIDINVQDCVEKEAGMRKLLEAKDCFVRACLPK